MPPYTAEWIFLLPVRCAAFGVLQTDAALFHSGLPVLSHLALQMFSVLPLFCMRSQTDPSLEAILLMYLWASVMRIYLLSGTDSLAPASPEWSLWCVPVRFCFVFHNKDCRSSGNFGFLQYFRRAACLLSCSPRISARTHGRIQSHLLPLLLHPSLPVPPDSWSSFHRALLPVPQNNREYNFAGIP